MPGVMAYAHLSPVGGCDVWGVVEFFARDGLERDEGDARDARDAREEGGEPGAEARGAGVHDSGGCPFPIDAAPTRIGSVPRRESGIRLGKKTR